jgi:uncharacterized protein
VVVLTGARQTGKTSTFLRLFPKHAFVSLDLPVEAEQGEKGPGIFLQRHPPPVLINEVQYAPDLFRHLKVVVDAHRTRNRKAPNSACSEFVTNSRPLDWLLAFRLRFALPSP